MRQTPEAEASETDAGLDELAARVLESLGAPAFSGSAGVLRAYAAHLRSRGRRRVVGIRRPADLPERTLDELAVLLRGQLVVETRAGEPVSVAAPGVEPTRGTGSAAPRASAGARRATRRLPLGLAVGAALAAALTWILLAAPGPGDDPDVKTAAPAALARPDPAAQAAETAAELGPGQLAAAAPVASLPEAPVARRPQRDAATPRDDVSDAVRSGRRALAALANARSDAEWEEGTRILQEIGPQPALMDALDEFGAQPGCVRRRGCVSTRARLQAALCTAWADAVERGEVPAGLRCS